MSSALSKNQKILKGIKTILEGLPFGLGTNIVMPLARRTLATVRNFPTRLMAFKIRMACENPDIKEFVVCFDLSVSALGLGEVFYSVMLARYAELHQKKIRFVFIEGKLRNDFAKIYYDTVLLYKQLSAMQLIPITLLDKNNSVVQSMSWNDFQKTIEIDSVKPNSTFIAMGDLVRHRKSTYNHVFNILNILLSYKSVSYRDEFLLDYGKLSKLTGISRPECNYITLHARYSLLWSKERNVEIETFKVICSYLLKKHHNHKIMIVSDEIGCNYFREHTRNMDWDLLFSKDYSTTFLDDGALILGSTFYFQFLGGGIGVIPMFSNISYEITCALANESKWSTSRLMSWQRQSQIFNVSTELSCITNS